MAWRSQFTSYLLLSIPPGGDTVGVLLVLDTAVELADPVLDVPERLPQLRGLFLVLTPAGQILSACRGLFLLDEHWLSGHHVFLKGLGGLEWIWSWGGFGVYTGVRLHFLRLGVGFLE